MYMQRLFVREQSEKASAPGKLYIEFRQWMRETFPHGPKWDFIMAQDEATGHSIELETVSSDELSGMESSQQSIRQRNGSTYVLYKFICSGNATSAK